jgi:hypothetical protein
VSARNVAFGTPKHPIRRKVIVSTPFHAAKILLLLFVQLLSMIFSENRCPLFDHALSDCATPSLKARRFDACGKFVLDPASEISRALSTIADDRSGRRSAITLTILRRGGQHGSTASCRLLAQWATPRSKSLRV